MDREALLTEQANLKRLLKKRENAAGYGDNVAAIKIRLAEIEVALSAE